MLDSEAGFEGCLQSVAEAASHGADLVEWRLDALGANIPSDLTSRSPLPSILTLRSVQEGGAFDGTTQELSAWIEAAAAQDPPPAWIDVEYSQWEVCDTVKGAVLQAQSQGCRVLCSSHDTAGRPTDLTRRVANMQAGPFDAVKMVWRARSLRDCIECRDLLANRDKPTVALCMGPAGVLSRVMTCAWGGLLTFAAADASSTTASGQPTVRDLLEMYRVRSLSSATKIYGLIGDPLGESPGYAMHNRAFAAAGFDGVYLPLPVAAGWESLKATLAVLLDESDSLIRGASVTLPHKRDALRYLEETASDILPAAQRSGAVNTLMLNAEGQLIGDNTDVVGIIASLQSGGAQIKGARAAVLGAGGVARAAISSLLEAGASVHVFNRTRARAESLVDSLQSLGFLQVEGEGPFDIVVQATSVGMAHGESAGQNIFDVLEIDPGTFVRMNGHVLETIYDPLETPFLVAARERGCQISTGHDMWLAQGSAQQERWTGKHPSVEIWKI